MNKILKMDERIGISLLSFTSMLFIFMSSYRSISTIFSFLFILIELIFFIVIPLFVYLLDRFENKLKKIALIYTSYFIINLLITVIVSFSLVNNQLSNIWKVIYDFITFFILVNCLLILFEQLFDYSEVEVKFYKKIMKFVYLIGNFISYPLFIILKKK